MPERLQRISLGPFPKEKGGFLSKDCCINVYALCLNEVFMYEMFLVLTLSDFN